MARRELSPTEIHRFTPTSLLRQVILQTIQDSTTIPSVTVNYGQANRVINEVHDAGRELPEHARGHDDGHFLEEMGDSSDGGDTYREIGSDILGEFPLPALGSGTPRAESDFSEYSGSSIDLTDAKIANSSVPMAHVSPALHQPTIATPATDLEEPRKPIDRSLIASKF